nr:unnamed protein product [Spirometra erinaceieuropaei]
MKRPVIPTLMTSQKRPSTFLQDKMLELHTSPKVMKINGRLNPEEQSEEVYRVPCLNCPCNCTDQAEPMPGVRMRAHNPAVRQGKELSQVASHAYAMGREVNLVTVKIIANAGSKTSSELIEASAWDENSVNRCIDLAQSPVQSPSDWRP